MDFIFPILVAAVVLIIAVAGFMAVRTRGTPRAGNKLDTESELSGQTAAEPIAGGEASTQTEAAPAPEAPPSPEPSEPPAPPRVAPFEPAPAHTAAPAPAETAPSRLSRGLAKTRGALGRTLSVLTGAPGLEEEDWDDVEAALIGADVGVKATAAIMQSLRKIKPTPQTLLDVLKLELLTSLSQTDRALEIREDGPSVWLVTGVNGVGKTTSIAKLAWRLKSEGRSVVLAAADTFRAAAIDQLGTWAERAGVHMVRHAPGADPGAVVFDAIEHAKAKGIDVVIADTAGRLHTKSNLMEELKKVHRIAETQAGGISEVLLVIDATVGQNGIAQARIFQEAVGVTGLILAKLDGSAKGGVAVAVEQELGIPVKMAGVGENLDDLEPFRPEEFVKALVGADSP